MKWEVRPGGPPEAPRDLSPSPSTLRCPPLTPRRPPRAPPPSWRPSAELLSLPMWLAPYRPCWRSLPPPPAAFVPPASGPVAVWATATAAASTAAPAAAVRQRWASVRPVAVDAVRRLAARLLAVAASMGSPAPSGRRLRSHAAAPPAGAARQSRGAATTASAAGTSKRRRPAGGDKNSSSAGAPPPGAAAEGTAAGAPAGRGRGRPRGAAKKRPKPAPSAAASSSSSPPAAADAAASAASGGSGGAVPRPRHYFLFKSEGASRIEDGVDAKFSIDDLAACAAATTPWDGVRNYEARNLIRSMRVGDRGLFYHSNVKEPGIVGVVEVVSPPRPDPTQFTGPHTDAKATHDAPRWDLVDVRLHRRMRRLVSLREIRARPALADMALVRRSRLSVSPVRREEWKEVLRMEQEGEADLEGGGEDTKG